jgi:GMP synthase (glutamine-hydrolysing)
MDSQHIAVIDFGSQYTQLIVRRIREQGFFSKLYQPHELKQTGTPAAVILSGGPRSVTEEGAPDIDLDYLQSLEVPVLGVCYGMQLLSKKLGGHVAPGNTREYGPAQLVPCIDNSLFAGLSPSAQIWMSHSDTVKQPPPGAAILGKNQHGVPVALQFGPEIFGIQFHPEVSHSREGSIILKNFLSLATGAKPFRIEDFKQELIGQIREKCHGREVVCGVSGGVDSTVLAVLLKEAGVPHRAIFVNNGLLRQNEVAEVQAQFRQLGVNLETIDAADQFLNALAGQTDPEKKRTIIGNNFLDVFWEAAANVDILAQGTLYPDVIESATSGSIASKIKTHHNRVDRVMALHKEGRVLEPLAELFKDEVRALGSSMGIPQDILHRHPFPGPGLAVRCPGEVTEEKLRIIRGGDAIFMRMLKEHGHYDKVWQAYCGLIPVKTVGVKGDERSYEFAVTLRAVTSEDAMTADFAKLPWEFLGLVSNAILNGVKGINRVLYDISTKPPASIEWE